MKLVGLWNDSGQLLRNTGFNSQIRHRKKIKYFYEKNTTITLRGNIFFVSL